MKYMRTLFIDFIIPKTAAVELDNFSRILEMEGVTVRRPEVRPGDFDRPVSTPDFESKSQLYAAMPRDILIVVSEIVLRPHTRVQVWRIFRYGHPPSPRSTHGH